MLSADHRFPRHLRVLSPPVKARLIAVGRAIKVGRLGRRMTNDDLANRLSVTRDTVSRIQRGDGSVAWATVLEAAHLVGVDLFDESRNGAIARAARDLELLPKRGRRAAKRADDDF